MTDFSVPQRMSPGVIPIMLVNNLQKTIGFFFVLIAVRIFDSDTDTADDSIWIRLLIIVAVLLAAVIAFTLLSYFPKKFHVSGGNLIFTHGLLRRDTTTIPLDRIHSLRTRRGLIYRLLGMRGISFDTLASKMEEIELILDESDWQSLMSIIEREESTQGAPDADAETQTPAAETTQFDNGNLILDALCQNHLKGMAVLVAALAFIYERFCDLSDNAIDTITDYASTYAEQIDFSPMMIVILAVAVYAVVVVLWMGKVLLRYSNMTLTRTRSLLTFNCGLLSRTSCRFAFDKVCTIWVKRNFLEKNFGFATLMLKQALNATVSEKEVGNIRIYGRNSSASFLEWWLGKDYADAPDIMTAASGKGAMTAVVLPAAVIAVVASAILCHEHLYVWTALPVIYLFYSIIRGIATMRRSRIILKDSYLIVDNGHFADIRNYLKYSNVEVVRVIATPLTPLFRRVTLALSTPGTTFKIRSLRKDEAELLRELLLNKSNKHN